MRKEQKKKKMTTREREREREREEKREHYLKALTNFVHVERRAAAAGHAAKSWREFSCASHYFCLFVGCGVSGERSDKQPDKTSQKKLKM